MNRQPKTVRTRESLLSAAVMQFSEYGYAETTMAAIAERAGLAKGTTYRYFDTKEALLEAVVIHLSAGLVHFLGEPSISEDETVADFLRRKLTPLLEQFDTSHRSDLARIVLAEGRKLPFVTQLYLREVSTPTNDFISAAAKVALSRGELQDDFLVHVPQLLVAPFWMSLIENQLLRPDGEFPAAELLEKQIDLVFCRPSQ